jgi:hypothetical protein
MSPLLHSTVNSDLDEIISAWDDLPLPLRAAVLAVVRTHRARILDSDILPGTIRHEDSTTGVQDPAKHLRHKHSALGKKTKTRKEH